VDVDISPPDGGADRELEAGLDRRSFLGRSAAVAGGLTLLGGSTANASRLLGVAGRVDREASGSSALTPAEMTTLKAVLDQLLPSDALGPGAVAAGVPAYIDRALAGSYRPLVPLYKTLLPMFDTAARSRGAKSFAALGSSDQIALLKQFEAGTPPGISRTAAASVAGDFLVLIEHMREGMFGDPMYGGNVGLAGWRLIGFPDIEVMWSARSQEIGVKTKPTGKTAKSYGGKPYNGTPS
jgi:gluconate 2-dehydrogenase gamma chain